MGNSSSRRNNTTNYPTHHHPPPPPHRNSSSYPPDPSFLPSSSTSSSSNPNPPPNFVFAANAPYSSPQYPPPPPQNPYPPQAHPSYYQYSGSYNNCGYGGPPMMNIRSNNYPPSYYANNNQNNNGWLGIRPHMMAPPIRPPPPYVDHQEAKKIRNDVNVHKDSIILDVDEENPECFLVSLTLDALVDGSITITYFGKEEADCSFVPLYPDSPRMSVRIPFLKGLGQKFRQPSGTGVDLGFFDLDDLSKPSPAEDVFPLVIIAESLLPQSDEPFVDQPRPTTSSNSQITQAIIAKNSGGDLQVKVIKQILWVDGIRYELREIYGIAKSAETGFDDSEPGKECVICMSEPKDTAVLPCRHMCMCSDCAKELRLMSNKCPICRQPIEQLIEIRVNKDEEQEEEGDNPEDDSTYIYRKSMLDTLKVFWFNKGILHTIFGSSN